MKRARVVVAAALGALMIGAVLGDALQSVPLDVSDRSAGEPILQAPTAAFDVAVAVMRKYGGLPRDAQLRGVAAETSSSAGAIDALSARQTPLVTGYTFTWQPRDEIGWGDHVIVAVGTALDERCLGSGTLPDRSGTAVEPATCRAYEVRDVLRATWVRRTWRPWPVRAVSAALRRWNAPLAPPPSSLRTRCQHIDMLALRRSAGTLRNPTITLGGEPRHRTTWSELTKAFRSAQSVEAHWSEPYPAIVLFEGRPPIPFSAAFFGDEGGIAVRFAHPSRSRTAYVPDWLSFESAVADPVCPPRRRQDAALPTTPAPTWETVVGLLRARAERESARRMAQVVSVQSRVVAMDRRDHSRATVIIQTGASDDGSWSATYVFDERSSAIVTAYYAPISK